MRRVPGLSSVIVLAALLSPATANADLLDTFRRLDLRGLSPAPLVPTKAPAALTPFARLIEQAPSLRRSGYALRLTDRVPATAVLVLSGGDYRNMKAALRDHRGERRRRTRVRGHRGFLFTHRELRELVWSEGGRIYDLGSGTPRKVSVAGMRATAASLEPLGHYYIGGSSDPNSSAGGDAATTAHTLSLRVEFEAPCTFSPHAGQAQVMLAPLRGNSFSFDVAEIRTSGNWTGTISGTVAADSITVQYQVSGSFSGGEQCSGSETLALPRNRR
jgi:hypothetical protein